MRLAALYLDDIVVIPAGKAMGPDQPRIDLRESSFHAAEGWDIRETLPGVFSLLCEGMPSPVTIGGYGYSYAPLNQLGGIAAPDADMKPPATYHGVARTLDPTRESGMKLDVPAGIGHMVTDAAVRPGKRKR